MYIIRDCLVFCEEDIYDEGCVPDSCNTYRFGLGLKHATKEGLIEQLMEYLDVKKIDMEFNACDEDGRIDIERLEDSDGAPVSKADIAKWKLGNKKLYSTIYIVNVEKTTKVKL